MKILGNVFIFVILYILFMLPTYYLPYLGSNSAIVGSLGAVLKAGVNPAFLFHFASLIILILVALFRGILIDKKWLVIFPILATVFDLAPGLALIPLIPTIMHILAIIFGVVGVKTKDVDRISTKASSISPTDAPVLPVARFDQSKWNALLKYDNDIASIADKIRPFGQKWLNEFASSYLALNDKQYLPEIEHKITVAATREKEEREQEVLAAAKAEAERIEQLRILAEKQKKAYEEQKKARLQEQEHRFQARKEQIKVWQNWIIRNRKALTIGGVVVFFVGVIVTVALWQRSIKIEEEARLAEERNQERIARDQAEERARIAEETAHREIEAKELSVSARDSWVDTGITLSKGERFNISASGQWSNGGDSPKFVGPSGFNNFTFPGAILGSANLASLIGQVNGHMFQIGQNYSGISPDSGKLMVSINDTPDSFADNNGNLKIQVSHSKRQRITKEQEEERRQIDERSPNNNQSDQPKSEILASTPLVQAGDSYVYESTNADNLGPSITTKRTVTSKSDKITLSVLNINSSNAKARNLYFTSDWNLIATRNADNSGFDYSPPLKYFDFPLYPGKTWQQTTTETNVKTKAIRIHKVSGIVEQWENVSVPAGSFRAIKISLQTELFDPTTGEKINGTDVSWYVPEIGRSIKSLTTGRDAKKQLVQLVQYEKSKTLWPDRDSCAGYTDNSLASSVTLACLQKIWLDSGCTTTGTSYPRNTNSWWSNSPNGTKPVDCDATHTGIQCGAGNYRTIVNDMRAWATLPDAAHRVGCGRSTQIK